MTCNTLIEPACKAAGHLLRSATAGVTGDVLSGIAQSVSDGVRWIVTSTATWWIRLPSPDLATQPAVTHIQQWLLPITVAVAVAGVIAAGARMALTRRATPLLDVTGGLVTIAAVTTLGVIVPELLIKAGDAWSTWVLTTSTGGHFTQRLIQTLDLGGAAAPVVVIIFGILAIIVSLAQAVLMLFRQASLIILAGVLPLAAAGSVAPATRPWVRRITAWMLALIFYKPAAAAVYAAAFTMIGTGGGTRTAVMGFVMLALSVVMLPALMRFFTWTTGTIASSGGGGQLLGAATMGAIAIGAMRSGGAASAQDQAAYLSSRLSRPPSGGTPLGAPTPAGPPSSGPAAGAGGPGAAGGGPTGGGAAGSPAGPAGGGFTGGASGAGPAGAPRTPAGGGTAPTGASAEAGGIGGAATTAGDTAEGVLAAARSAAVPVKAAASPAVRTVATGAQVTDAAGRLAPGAIEPGDQP